MLDILDKGTCTIEKVRQALNNYLNKQVIIKYDLGRNKYETYHVIIKKTYNCVFLVEVCNPNKTKKSFSYTDIITKTIKIYDK